MLMDLLNLWPALRPIATCAPLSPHWPLFWLLAFGSVVFFAPLRFVLRSLGVALRLVSVVSALRHNSRRRPPPPFPRKQFNLRCREVH
jgi:hypothetical protein